MKIYVINWQKIFRQNIDHSSSLVSPLVNLEKNDLVHSSDLYMLYLYII